MIPIQLQRNAVRGAILRRGPSVLICRPSEAPGWLAAGAWAQAPLLLASCTEGNSCDKPPVGIGAVVTDVQAAADPCAGQPPLHVVAWYMQGGTRSPLRCGKTGRGGYGYLHTRYDGGHGDP